MGGQGLRRREMIRPTAPTPISISVPGSGTWLTWKPVGAEVLPKVRLLIVESERSPGVWEEVEVVLEPPVVVLEVVGAVVVVVVGEVLVVVVGEVLVVVVGEVLVVVVVVGEVVVVVLVPVLVVVVVVVGAVVVVVVVVDFCS